MLLAPFAIALATTTHALPTPVDALASVRTELATALDPVLADRGLRHAKVGLHVTRLDDGAELYSHDADALLVPASNIKLVTTAAALRVLSPDYQFPTEIYGNLTPSGLIEGDLTLKGYGDPYLIPERVWYLASRLFFLGIRQVTGDIVVDDSYFDGPRVAVGWEQDHTASAYMAPAGAVSVGFNALLVHVLPGAQPGQDARIMLDPASAYAPIVGTVQTVARGRSSVSVDVVPMQTRVSSRPTDGAAGDANQDIVRVSGRIALADSGRAYWRRINNPPVFAGEVLRSALNQVGISVSGIVRTGTVTPTMNKVYESLSPRLAELVGPLNKYSNNYMAAQVAYALGAHRFGAPGNWDKGRRAIEEFLTTQVHIPAGTYDLNNASGLHEVNHFSARQIVRLLDYMYRQTDLWPEFANSLAVAGGSGTLSDRMQQTPAAHILRAKTGTLSGASALSGYVTARNGETLAFSMIVNGYHNIEGVWAAQDRLGATLAGLNFAPIRTPPVSPPATTVSAAQPLPGGDGP